MQLNPECGIYGPIRRLHWCRITGDPRTTQLAKALAYNRMDRLHSLTIVTDGSHFATEAFASMHCLWDVPTLHSGRVRWAWGLRQVLMAVGNCGVEEVLMFSAAREPMQVAGLLQVSGITPTLCHADLIADILTLEFGPRPKITALLLAA